MPKLRFLPSEARRRGLPPVGIDLDVPAGVAVEPPPEGAIARLVEAVEGRQLGVMTFELVAARLVIDRDGTLADLATRAPHAVPQAVEVLLGAGYRAGVVLAAGPRRYVGWLALAPVDAGAGGAVVVTIETTGPDWRAGEEILATLRVLARDADARAATEPSALPLPFIKPSGS